MKWSEIRDRYPQQWLLIEAIEARSEANQRVLDDIAVLDTFPDSVAAMKRYTSLHHEAPQRELYVCHTDREDLAIRERQWLGIRCAPWTMASVSSSGESSGWTSWIPSERSSTCAAGA